MKNWRSIDRFPVTCLIAVIAITAISGIRPFERTTWWLEILPILIVVPLLLATYARFRLSNLLYALIVVHALVLAVGGHYTYARVPLFDWIRDYFHDTRNSYDAIGHLAQGLVPAIAIRELLLRTSPLKPGKWLFTIIVFCCLGISALYEISEWLTAFAMGNQANDFLGTQGDMWDTQKDMAFAGIGAIIGLLLLNRWHDRSLRTLTASIHTSRLR